MFNTPNTLLAENGPFRPIYKLASDLTANVQCYADANNKLYVVKASYVMGWRREMAVYTAIKANRLTSSNVQEILAAGELPEALKVDHFTHCIITSYNNMQDINYWRACCRTIDEELKFEAAEQTLLGIRQIHAAGFVSRDIKPENIGVHIGDGDDVHRFLIYDLEHAQRYVNRATGETLTRRPTRGVGTMSHAPLVQMTGTRPAFPVDDVEAWFYCLYDIFGGCVPWDKTVAKKQWRIEGPFPDPVAKKEHLDGRICQTKQRMHMERGEYIPYARKYRPLMSALFNLIVEWGEEKPEAMEPAYYDKIVALLRHHRQLDEDPGYWSETDGEGEEEDEEEGNNNLEEATGSSDDDSNSDERGCF